MGKCIGWFKLNQLNMKINYVMAVYIYQGIEIVYISFFMNVTSLSFYMVILKIFFL